jgi:cytochrome c oxidase assembly protein subunit 15
MNQEEWEAEFAKYQAFPEYENKSGAKTVEEFKPIFFLEWGHRMWGRVIGVVFAGGAGFFAMKGRLPRHLWGRLTGLFALGGAQGLVGWWMVKSGLEARQEHRHKHATQEVRVSPYRLATHLGTAFVTLAGLLWTGFGVLHPTHATMSIPAHAMARAGTILKMSRFATVILGVTVVSGAFVAGNDAGCAYNTWPKMGDEWFPSEYWAEELGVRNFFENTACVQFDHRALAYTTATTVLAMWGLARANPAVYAALPGPTKLALNAALGMTAAQVALGITALLNYVPVELGAAHQGGAVVLFSISMFLLHSLQFARGGAGASTAIKAAVRGMPKPTPAPVMAAARRTE